MICTILIFEGDILEIIYVNHAPIIKDKLCPFKLLHASSTTKSKCNWHKNIEIFLITDGKGVMQYSTESIPLSSEDIVVVNSSVLHRPYSETGIGYYFLIIDDTFCIENGIDVSSFTFEKKFRSAETKSKFQSVIIEMNAYKEKPCQLSVIALRSAVLSLLADLCANHATAVGADRSDEHASERHVKLVIDYVNEHFSEPICLETLAGLCSITKYHLAREFKKHTGQTVFTYLNSLRCKNAALCISKGMSVTDAAYASGFQSLSYFSRTYKSIMGQSPAKTILEDAIREH